MEQPLGLAVGPKPLSDFFTGLKNLFHSPLGLNLFWSWDRSRKNFKIRPSDFSRSNNSGRGRYGETWAAWSRGQPSPKKSL